MTFVGIDFETRSTVDLRKAGVYRYAEDPTTGVWCMAYAFEDEEPGLWLPGQVFPRRLADHVAAGEDLRAWNAQFERVIWRTLAQSRYGFPSANGEQFVCTAAEAAAMALPRSLDQCASVLKVGAQKDGDGYRLMMQMAKPRKIHADGRIEWWDQPEKVKRLGAYCQQDVRAEQAVYKAVKRLPEQERRLYLLDQRINDRGMQVDVELARGAKAIVTAELERANRIVQNTTAGLVGGVSKREQMLEWLRGEGLEIDNLQKTTVQEMLSGDQPDHIRAVLEARAEAGRSSVSKIDAIFECLCADNRVRGLLLYHGASTGRWAGKLVQPHNFPRGEIKGVEQYLDLVRAGDWEAIDLFDPPIVVVLSLLRGLFVPAAGRVYRAADFSQIEARVTALLAGQRDLVARFANNDPVYEEMAAATYTRMTGSLVRPEEIGKDDPRRQLGKAQVLGCGFGMGWKKFRSSAALAPYFVTLTDEEAQIAVETYRNRNREIVGFWRDINQAVIAAVREPGTVHAAREHIRVTHRGAYLWVRLPSGRFLCYAAPRLRMEEMPWGESLGVTVQSMNGVTRKWEPTRLYGGLLTENVVQATARDIMAEAMLRAEAQGYPVVLTVHDEVVTEPEAQHGSQEHFEQIIAAVPEWVAGCPIAVEGWSGERYRK